MHHPWLLSSITIINHHEGEGYEINEIISFPTPWKGNICYSPGEFVISPPLQRRKLCCCQHYTMPKMLCQRTRRVQCKEPPGSMDVSQGWTNRTIDYASKSQLNAGSTINGMQKKTGFYSHRFFMFFFLLNVVPISHIGKLVAYPYK